MRTWSVFLIIYFHNPLLIYEIIFLMCSHSTDENTSVFFFFLFAILPGMQEHFLFLPCFHYFLSFKLLNLFQPQIDFLPRI